MPINNKIKGIAAALVSSGTFGMIPLFTIPLMTLGAMNEISILFYRYLFAVLGLAVLCLAGKKSLRISFHTLTRVFLMSLLYAGTGVALIYSYNYLSSGIVTTIHFLYPVLVAILMIIIYREKLSHKIILAALATIIGVGVLSWTNGGLINIKGILLALTTAITYAFYIVGLNQKAIKELDGMVMIFYVMLFGLFFFGLLAYFEVGFSPIPNVNSFINLLLLAWVPTIVSNYTLILGVKYAGATTTSILGSAEPIVAVFFGVVKFSEQLTANVVLGIFIIIAAVTYVIFNMSKEKGFIH